MSLTVVTSLGAAAIGCAERRDHIESGNEDA
jgi:hypothetical protein